jgi:hypothetical protein
MQTCKKHAYQGLMGSLAFLAAFFIVVKQNLDYFV